MLNKEIKELLKKHQSIKTQLSQLKRVESDLRDQIVIKAFGDMLKEGTSKAEIDHNTTLVAKQTYKREINADAMKLALKQLPRGSKSKLIKESYALKKRAYDALSMQEKEIFDECLTIKPNKPTIEIKTKENK